MTHGQTIRREVLRAHSSQRYLSTMVQSKSV